MKSFYKFELVTFRLSWFFCKFVVYQYINLQYALKWLVVNRNTTVQLQQQGDSEKICKMNETILIFFFNECGWFMLTVK